MPTNEEIQNSLKGVFRPQELVRREERRIRLLNEAALAQDTLSADDTTREAIKQIADTQRQYRNRMVPRFPSKAYWKRLWAALRAKEE